MEETYGNPNATQTVVIANGGAGPTGIIRAFAEAYLSQTPNQNVNIKWVQSHTLISLDSVKKGTAHCCLTYEPELEKALLASGEAENYKYIFNDHFILVGPKEGSKLDITPNTASKEQVLEAFGKIPNLQGGQRAYISRDDGSATNAKEISIFQQANIQLPTENNSWYYRMPSSEPRFPSDCLKLAVETKSFCLIDRGTFLMNKDAQEHLSIYVQGGEAPEDILLNPCHALVTSKQSEVQQFANYFVDFMARNDGQKIVSTFGVDKPSNLLKRPFFTPVGEY